jgi:hypothetical protein
MYPAVLHMCFISAAVILLASLALIVQVSLPYSKAERALIPKWQKESWQNFEETSGYVRQERVNKWPNSMTDI